MSWRDHVENSKYVKLEEGVYHTVLLDLINVNTDLNKWDRKIWVFKEIDEDFKKTGNVLAASQMLLNKIGHATEGMNFAACKIRRTGSGKDTRYEVSAEDLDPEQTRFV